MNKGFIMISAAVFVIGFATAFFFVPIGGGEITKDKLLSDGVCYPNSTCPQCDSCEFRTKSRTLFDTLFGDTR